MTEKTYKISETLLGKVKQKMLPILQNLSREAQEGANIWKELNSLQEVLPVKTAAVLPKIVTTKKKKKLKKQK